MISVDGNIGSGKSTVLTALAERGYTVHKEAIDKWPLEEFYSDPVGWAMPMQLAVLHSMRPDEGIHERCPDSAFSVFWKGGANEQEDKVVREFFQRHRWSPAVHVYLKASPEWCYKNMKKRTQAGDSGVTMEYLQELHAKYESFFATVPHVAIDAERPVDAIVSEIICHCK